MIVVCKRHELVTKQVIDQFIGLWKSKQFAIFVRPPVTTESQLEMQDNENRMNISVDQTKKSKSIDTIYLFAMVLSPVCVFAQQNRPSATFDKLALLITALIKNSLMSVAFLNEQCMKLMHHQWNQVFSSSIQFPSHTFDRIFTIADLFFVVSLI